MLKMNLCMCFTGQVISKLSEGAEHIPFRGSRLTRILKNSLGGNAKTTIICTISPAELDQTKSTLEFASRAKKIVQHAKKNEVRVRFFILFLYLLHIQLQFELLEFTVR